MFPSISDFGFRVIGECLIYPFTHYFQGRTSEHSKTLNDMELKTVVVEKVIADNSLNPNVVNLDVDGIPIEEAGTRLETVVVDRSGDNSKENHLQKLYGKLNDLNAAIPSFPYSRCEAIGLITSGIMLIPLLASAGYVMHDGFTINDPTEDDRNRILGISSGIVGLSIIDGLVFAGIAFNVYFKNQVRRFTYRYNNCKEISNMSKQIIVDKNKYAYINNSCLDNLIWTEYYGLGFIDNKSDKSDKLWVNMSRIFCIKENYIGDFDINEDRSVLYYINTVGVVDNNLKLCFFPIPYMISDGNIVPISKDDIVANFSLYINLGDVLYTAGNKKDLKSELTEKGFSKDKHRDEVGQKRMFNERSNTFCLFYKKIENGKSRTIHMNNNLAEISSSSDSEINLTSVFPLFIKNTISLDKETPSGCQLLFKKIDKLRDEHSVFVSKNPLCALPTKCTGDQLATGDSSSKDPLNVLELTEEPQGNFAYFNTDKCSQDLT